MMEDKNPQSFSSEKTTKMAAAESGAIGVDQLSLRISQTPLPSTQQSYRSSPGNKDPLLPIPLTLSPTEKEAAPVDNLEDSGSGDDQYRLVVRPEQPRKTTERRRADNMLFQSWLKTNQNKLSKKKTLYDQKDPEYMSAARLVRDNENKRIIATPREYQIELFERAKSKNTICVLETGRIMHCASWMDTLTLETRIWQNPHRGASSATYP
jgi:hypothetical protein